MSEPRINIGPDAHEQALHHIAELEAEVELQNKIISQSQAEYDELAEESRDRIAELEGDAALCPDRCDPLRKSRESITELEAERDELASLLQAEQEENAKLRERLNRNREIEPGPSGLSANY